MIPPEINETNFRASDISPTEIVNPEMEMIFLKNELEIMKRRFNMLLQILEINHAGACE